MALSYSDYINQWMQGAGSPNWNPYGGGIMGGMGGWGGYRSEEGRGDVGLSQVSPRATSSGGAITYPTADESWAWASGLQPSQAQAGLLGTMSSPQGFMASIQPYINQMMTSLGRSQLPSSSYADRMMGNTLGSLWAQNALGTASGWGNYASGLGNLAAGYAQYPLLLAQLLKS